MIDINLLPSDYRKAERTPFVIFLPLIAGLVCVLSAGALAGYVRFSWLAETRAEREQLERTLAEKHPSLIYNTKLLAEESEYKVQAETITNIASGRVLMTQRLDELCQLISEGDAGQHGGFMIWLKDLTAKPAPAARGRTKGPTTGGSLEFGGFALADTSPLQDFNRLHRAIKDSEMYRDGYLGMNDPQGSVQDFNDDSTPRKGWSFDLELTMKDPSERFKERAEASKLLAKKESKR